MDRYEAVALCHLRLRGFKNPEYEPDGNVPPDFLLPGGIAVEVRCLNENVHTRRGPEGLAEAELPLIMGVQRLSASYGPAAPDGWWLILSYRRPFPRWSRLKRRARAFLDRVKEGTAASQSFVNLHPNVQIRAMKRAGGGGSMFHLAVMDDKDSGGWLLDALQRNISICIADKVEKLRPHRYKYSTWWLLLVDEIACGLSEADREWLQANVVAPSGFDKIIVVSALDPRHHLDL